MAPNDEYCGFKILVVRPQLLRSSHFGNQSTSYKTSTESFAAVFSIQELVPMAGELAAKGALGISHTHNGRRSST
jgi:hypothetical protein